jgi:hypothetical protein
MQATHPALAGPPRRLLMIHVLFAVLTVIGAVVVGIQVVEPAVDRVRAGRRPAPAARDAEAREGIVLGVGIR